MHLGKFCAAMFASLLSTCALADEFQTETGYLRVKVDGHSYRLESRIIKRADATGKLPIALITHGSADSLLQRLNQHTPSIEPQARDFAARGYLAVAVMRRGFGSSDGPLPSSGSCPVKSYVERFEADADDLQGALEAVSKRPDADPDHIIAVGVSAGGPAVIALGARNPPGLKSIVSISGGLVSLACPKEEALLDAYRGFEARNRVPQLWVYARNDSLFGPSLVERLRDVSLDAEADVKVVNFEAMGRDGHDIFSTAGGRLAWLSEADGFLRAHEMPTWSYGEVNRLLKLLKFKETDRTFIETYLTAPDLKAMARSRDGSRHRFFFNARDLDGVRGSVLKSCDKPDDPCEIVMENNRIVADWAAPPEDRKVPESASTTPPTEPHDAGAP